MSDTPSSDPIQRWRAEADSADVLRRSETTFAGRPPQMETACALLDEQLADLDGRIGELEHRLAGVVRPNGDDALVAPSLADAGEFVRWPREILMHAERIQSATARLRSLLDRLEV